MFTWEEAGLLRQMLLVLKWSAIAGLCLVGLWLGREPLLSAFGITGPDAAGQTSITATPRDALKER
jgi:hypothetical protein